MDENLQELENELKRLTPRQPSPALLQAWERELGPPATPAGSRPRYSAATTLSSWKWMSWSLAGAAAALAVFAVVQSNRGSTQPDVPASSIASTELPVTAETTIPPPVNRYEPVRASSVLYDMKEDGTATLPDQTEGRQVRYRYVDTYTWKNPATNASLRWSVPRDEVRFVRASLD